MQVDNQKENATENRERPSKQGRPRQQIILNNMVKANVPITVDEAMKRRGDAIVQQKWDLVFGGLA